MPAARVLGAVILQDQLAAARRVTFREVVIAALKSLTTVRHIATALFRLSQVAGDFSPALGHAVKQLNHVITGADIAWQAKIGAGLVLHHPTGVVIGPGAVLGENCRLQQGITIGGRGGRAEDGTPRFGNSVIMGAGSRAMGPIEVGDGVVIGANAVVIADVSAGSVAVGIPARVHRRE